MESFPELIDEAMQMLQDRSRYEQDLIYHVAGMENELRTAIVIAYQILNEPGPKAA